ncbi:LysR family transcriptional regulator [Paenibacillus sp. IB182496]|uniref:LysR family transcriptional regulator n=1 Tax=Paenibacillus sabuli TaxID=2772509 RepID=A0A927GS07_9BACL|nr:LysR family transcriptional regulator [Paenibacillus sabuli]MBD2846048.1 LysR family transcriptional regulator [Paenibacillus sabuli]
MELRQLHYFLKVAKKEHVTKAAAELHVAQSAISRQIHQLEQELGVELFGQKGRNLQLTPVGRLFAKRIESVLTDLERAVVELHEFIDPEMGEIRLGFPHSLGVQMVPQMISDFRKLHPNVKFKFKQGTYHSLIADVVTGEVDLALISPCPERHELINGDLLLTEELYAVLPPNHELAERRAIALAELSEEAFVLFGEGYSLRPIVWEACRNAGFTPKVSFESEETETIRGLVAAGMGVSVLPDMALQHLSGPLQPAKVRISSPEVTRTIGLIQKKSQALSLVSKVFHHFLVDYFPADR